MDGGEAAGAWSSRRPSEREPLSGLSLPPSPPPLHRGVSQSAEREGWTSGAGMAVRWGAAIGTALQWLEGRHKRKKGYQTKPREIAKGNGAKRGGRGWPQKEMGGAPRRATDWTVGQASGRMGGPVVGRVVRLPAGRLDGGSGGCRTVEKEAVEGGKSVERGAGRTAGRRRRDDGRRDGGRLARVGDREPRRRSEPRPTALPPTTRERPSHLSCTGARF